ncbi:MAG: SH3 domain-containing protein [Candidatus Omnitrophica bacterium]|nr:SH3 domain-containing protein [Candidatus Omnitrophota bacterium]
MRKRDWWSVYLLVALVFAGYGCAHSRGAVLYSPPSVLAHTTPEMRTAGFWIGRHPSPDSVILSSEEIQRFNQTIREELKLTKDLSVRPASISGKELRASLQKTLDDLQARKLKLLDGKNPSPAYWDSAREAMNNEAIPAEIPRQYGLIVRYADQRFLPLEEGLYAQAYDEDFDELQNSALDIGTPIVILHRSRDGQWVWVESATSAGWVKAKNVALATEDQVKPFWSTPFVVAAVPRADIFLDRALTNFGGSLQMGTRLPLMRLDGDFAEITLPQRHSDGSVELVPGFVTAEQVHEGYLPYTPRQILSQAFKMFGQPYGWGGMYGAQDCSRFLQEVFATVGIELPRDSKNQIQVGTRLIEWETGTPGENKTLVLTDFAIGGITILGMKGHILLYLGSIDGRVYAIHSVWAYREPGDRTYVLNRVVVSDLSLGEGSKRGSLLERLNTARLVK